VKDPAGRRRCDVQRCRRPRGIAARRPELSRNGYYKILEHLLAYTDNSFGALPDSIQLASARGHPKTLRVLLDAYKPSSEDEMLRECMVLAAGRGQFEVVEEFVKPVPNKGLDALPAVVLEGSAAYLLPCDNPSLCSPRGLADCYMSGEPPCMIKFNHPVPPKSPYFYFETAIEVMGTEDAELSGLYVASAYTDYSKHTRGVC